MANRRFFLAAALAALLLTAVALLLHRVAPSAIPPALAWIPPGLALLTAMLHAWIVRSSARSPQRFVTAFMGAVSVKLLATALFLGIYLLFHREQKVPVALGTFAYYVIFTVLLIISLRRHALQR